MSTEGQNCYPTFTNYYCAYAKLGGLVTVGQVSWQIYLGSHTLHSPPDLTPWGTI